MANLFNLSFQMERNGKFLTLYPKIPDSEKTSFLSRILSDKPSWEKVFSSSSTSILWKARLSVVQRYTDIVNSLTGRKKKFTIKQLIRHWREKLLLPVPLANNLNPEEYASLVEGISANSPIEVQAEAVRHYPYND